MLHISSEVRTLSNFVETDPNDVYNLLKDPVNLLVLHPKVEVDVYDSLACFIVFIKLCDSINIVMLLYVYYYNTLSVLFEL
jgi:hypothetical protein